MTISDWIAIVGIAVVVVLAAIAAIRRHAKNDIDFQTDVIRHRSSNDEKVKRLAADYELLHAFKNSALPELFERYNKNIYNVLDRVEKDINRRLERIEKHMDGEVK